MNKIVPHNLRILIRIFLHYLPVSNGNIHVIESENRNWSKNIVVNYTQFLVWFTKEDLSSRIVEILNDKADGQFSPTKCVDANELYSIDVYIKVKSDPVRLSTLKFSILPIPDVMS